MSFWMRREVAEIGVKREKKEERAEDVFALGDPGDGFDAERVEREEGGDEQAAPVGAGEAAQPCEEQKRTGDVEEDVDEMRAGGARAEEGVVELVREPRDRVPVARVTGGERPADAGSGQTVEDAGIFGDVVRIVIRDEVVMTDGKEEEGGEGEEKERGKVYRGARVQVRGGGVCRGRGHEGESEIRRSKAE